MPDRHARGGLVLEGVQPQKIANAAGRADEDDNGSGSGRQRGDSLWPVLWQGQHARKTTDTSMAYALTFSVP